MAFYNKTDDLPRDPSAIDQGYSGGGSILSAVIILLIVAAAFGLYFMYVGPGPPPEPARVRGASVTFEPSARTARHTHPLGQTLIVVAGCGWAQRWRSPIEEIRPGDVIWFPPGEKHWHGATPMTAMTHIAIQEAFDGKTVDWMEQVSDEQYGR